MEEGLLQEEMEHVSEAHALLKVEVESLSNGLALQPKLAPAAALTTATLTQRRMT